MREKLCGRTLQFFWKPSIFDFPFFRVLFPAIIRLGLRLVSAGLFLSGTLLQSSLEEFSLYAWHVLEPSAGLSRLLCWVLVAGFDSVTSVIHPKVDSGPTLSTCHWALILLFEYRQVYPASL